MVSSVYRWQSGGRKYCTVSKGTSVQCLTYGTSVQRLTNGTSVQRLIHGTSIQRLTHGTSVQRFVLITEIPHLGVCCQIEKECLPGGTYLEHVISSGKTHLTGGMLICIISWCFVYGSKLYSTLQFHCFLVVTLTRFLQGHVVLGSVGFCLAPVLCTLGY